MVVQLTPIAIDRIGWGTYAIFTALNTIWVPIIFFFFPETKGLELEDVDRLFSGQDTCIQEQSAKNSPGSVAEVQIGSCGKPD